MKKKFASNLSIACAISVNSVQVNRFFDLYQKWLKDWKIELAPNHIWNVDKSGLSDVPKPQKVIGVSCERSFQTVFRGKPNNTTLVTYISAGGVAIPGGTKPKHIALLDLHKSHLFNLHYMQYMKANGLEVCSFPPHCTHIIQPLDDLPYAIL